jgi:hypothetical protein
MLPRMPNKNVALANTNGKTRTNQPPSVITKIRANKTSMKAGATSFLRRLARGSQGSASHYAASKPITSVNGTGPKRSFTSSTKKPETWKA